MTDRKELIEVLEHCMKDDCNGCPNHYTDGRMACDDYIYGMSASMPVARIQDAVDLLKEQNGYVSVPFSWLVKFCTHIDFKEPVTDEERELLWKQKLKQQFGIELKEVQK